MKLQAVVLVFAFGACANASFDLMLMADQNTKRIHRYDPENEVSLGSFGTSVGVIYDIAVNKSAGEVYVLTIGFNGSSNTLAMQRYNYSTGAYLGTNILGVGIPYGAPSKMEYTNNGEVLISFGARVARYDVSTGAQVGVSLAYDASSFTYIGGAALLPSGSFCLAGDSTGSFSNDFLLLVNSSSFLQNSISVGPFATTAIRSLVSSGNRLLVSTEGPASVGYQTIDVSGISFVGGASYSISGVPLINHGAEFGHGNQAYTMYSLASTPSVYYMRRFDTTAGVIGPELVVPFSGNLAGTAMVVAPEPATLFVLGLGVGALLKRRRS